MHLLRLIIFVGVFSGMVGFGCADALEPNVTLFDALITKDVIARELGPRKPFDFSVTGANSEVQHFVAEYRFNRRNPAEHYTLDISVAPVGHFLDPSTYKHRRDSEAQGDTPLEADYPAIGQRARREFSGTGPGGSAYGLTFTTSDGRFDVRITVSNLMPEGIEEPRFDLEGFAQRLSDRYDAKTSAIEFKTPQRGSK